MGFRISFKAATTERTLPQFQIPRRVSSPTGPPEEISRVSGGRSTPPAPTKSLSSCDDDDDDIFCIFFPSNPIRTMKCTQSAEVRSSLLSVAGKFSCRKLRCSVRRRRYDDSLALRSHSRIAIGRIEKKASRYAALCSTNPARVFGPPRQFLWAPSIVHAHCLLVVASAVQGVPLNASTSSLRYLLVKYELIL